MGPEGSREVQTAGVGRILYANDVESLVFDWGTLRFVSAPDVTGAQRFSFGIVTLAAGKGHDSHSHPGVEEIIYVVSGEGEQTLGQEPPVPVRDGASIFVPPDMPHSTLNTGTDPLCLVVVYAPAGPERELRDLPGCQVIPPEKTGSG
jgi:oxalate decarboxylase/phosphoglucose isomerase-like protein (cupin superfamily)